MWLGASAACVGTYKDTLHQNVAFCLTAAWNKPESACDRERDCPVFGVGCCARGVRRWRLVGLTVCCDLRLVRVTSTVGI